MQKLIYNERFPFSVLDGNGELVAYCGDYGLSQMDREDMARRLVACFNACAGIPIHGLEGISFAVTLAEFAECQP